MFEKSGDLRAQRIYEKPEEFRSFTQRVRNEWGEFEEFHRFRGLLLKSREKIESGRDEGTSKKIC
jgi:hypothetical protein